MPADGTSGLCILIGHTQVVVNSCGLAQYPPVILLPGFYLTETVNKPVIHIGQIEIFTQSQLILTLVQECVANSHLQMGVVRRIGLQLRPVYQSPIQIHLFVVIHAIVINITEVVV